MTTRGPDSVGRFALRSFLWLPGCFAAWYFGAQYLAPLVGWLSGLLVDLVKSGLVSAVEREALELVFVTNIEVHPTPDQTAVLLVEVNSLLYTYGLPLFVALMLAARAKAWKMLAGAALLLPFQAWGAAFDFLAQVGVKAGMQVSIQAGLMGWRAELIAIAYQLGTLMFPVLAPVALWVGFNQALLARLAAPQKNAGKMGAQRLQRPTEPTMSFVADRLKAIKPSPTLLVSAKAAKLKSEGKDVIAMGAGEPDFDTPQFIKDAAIAAMNKGLTKYTAAGGTPSLRKAIAAKFKRENGLDYSEKQILVSCGGKQTSFNLCLALLNEGDEAIVPAPYWVSYPDMAMMAQGKPVFIQAGIEQGFKITPQQLEAAITPRSRLIWINSPSNPTGATYTADELKGLAEVLRKHPRIVIASDDMYEHILLDGSKFVDILNVAPDLYDRTVTMNGVSKAYSMTGWRIGYCGGPQELIDAMENVQSHSTSNPTSISQYAAEAALSGDQSCIDPMVAAFKERGKVVADGLNRIPGVRCLQPTGAFYAFPDCREAIRKLHAAGKLAAPTDVAFCEYLMVQPQGVAAVPGSAFGAEGYLRISFATSMDNIRKAVDRIAAAVSGVAVAA